MAKPPGSCPFKDNPANCPAVKALQDAVDASEKDWRRLDGIEMDPEVNGETGLRLFRVCYELVKDMAPVNVTIIESNRVEPRD